jgi:alpha-tubulin suppressor-like RCC1 family protein
MKLRSYASVPVFLCSICVGLLSAGPASAQVKRWGLVDLVPTAVAGLSEPVLIEAGNANGYATESNGTVKAWGSRKDGAPGDERNKSSESAVTVTLPAGVKGRALGEAERSGFVATTTGEVYDWGDNKNGDLCQGPQETPISTPRKIEGLTEVLAVQGAEHNVMFLLASGEVMVCGWNNEGQIGLPATVREATAPTLVLGLKHVVELSAGPKVSAVRTESGEVLTTGTNRGGQLGLGTGIKKSFGFTRVSLPGPASEISVGGDGKQNSHSFALIGGIPYGWGVDEYGEVGDGSTASKYTPVVASELTMLGALKEVRAGGHSSAVLTEAGVVETLGGNEAGELGVGERGPSFGPLPVESEVIELSVTARIDLVRRGASASASR